MKITILGSDLSQNEMGRLYLLGRILQRRYVVEITGLSFGNPPNFIWKPVMTGEIPITPIPSPPTYPQCVSAIKELLRHIHTDVIYAEGLLPSSFGVGLLKKYSKNIPLILDTGDWYLGQKLLPSFLQNIKWSFRTIHHINSIPYSYLTEKLFPLADKITGSNSFVVNRYQGIFIPHARDTEVFNPVLFDRIQLRSQMNISREKIILFLGTPHPHKGLHDLISAVKILNRDDTILHIVGVEPRDPFKQSLLSCHDSQIKIFSEIPFSKVPEHLAIADIIAVPQRKTIFSNGQMPAKIYDAMAMAKPIVASRLGDIPSTIEGCGYLFEPGNVDDLSRVIMHVLDHPEEAKQKGERARQRCIENFSWNAVENRLIGIFEPFSGTTRR